MPSPLLLPDQPHIRNGVHKPVQPTSRRRAGSDASAGTADQRASALFHAARTRGITSRRMVAAATGMSMATVNRQTGDLLRVGMLRERPDLVTRGGVGRPPIPIEVNHDPFLTVGIHIGTRSTVIVACDLRGRILGGIETPTPRGLQEDAIDQIACSTAGFMRRWRKRSPLWTGVAIGGRVDPEAGIVEWHPGLQWTSAPVETIMASRLALPISVMPQAEAMAAAESQLPPMRPRDEKAGVELYLYARETTGLSLVAEPIGPLPSWGPGSIAHLPTGSDLACVCGSRGCLEATVSDRVLVAAAARAGAIDHRAGQLAASSVAQAASNGSVVAHDLLVERACTLGRTAAMLADLFNADGIVVGGQPFTEYPAAIPHLLAEFAKYSIVKSRRIVLTRFGNRVQGYAAAMASLASIFADPIAARRFAE